MKVLFLLDTIEHIHLAYKIASEGHNVYLYLPYETGVGSGIINRIEAWRPEFRSSDLIIIDAGYQKYETVFRDAGKTVLNCSAPLSILAQNPVSNFRVFQALTINHPDYWVANSEESEDNLSDLSFPNRYQVVSETHDYIVETLSQINWASGLIKGEYVVYRDLEGPMAYISGMFNGRDWVNPFFVTGYDMGPTNLAKGAVTFGVESCNLTKATLEPLTEKLRKLSYRGMLTMRCKINQQSVWIDRFDMGFPYLVTESLVEGVLGRQSIFDILFEAAGGFLKTIEFTKDNVIAVPTILSDAYDLSYSNFPIEFSDNECRPHYHMCGVHYNDGFKVGEGSMVGVATARGRSISEARSRVYRTLSNVRVPSLHYSKSIGKSQDSMKTELSHWKLI